MIQVTNGSKDHIDSVNKVTIMLSHQNWAVFKQFWNTCHSKSIIKNSIRGDCPLSQVTAWSSLSFSGSHTNAQKEQNTEFNRLLSQCKGVMQ